MDDNLLALWASLKSKLTALEEEKKSVQEEIKICEDKQVLAIQKFQEDISKTIKTLTEKTPNIYSEACEKINSLYKLADNLSYQIKGIDTAIGRCSGAIEVAKNLRDLHECFELVLPAKESENTKNLCNNVQRLLKIPTELLDKNECDKIIQYQNRAKELLDRKIASLDHLNNIFDDNQENYSILKEMNEILYQYDQIGENLWGIKVFTEKISRDIITDNTKEIPSINNFANVDVNQTAIHLEVFRSTIISIRKIISNEIGPLGTDFGDPSLFTIFIRYLLEKMDPFLAKILSNYESFRKKYIEQVPKEMNPLNFKKANPSSERVVQLDHFNKEISYFALVFYDMVRFVQSQFKEKSIHDSLKSSLYLNFKFANESGNRFPNGWNSFQTEAQIRSLLVYFIEFTKYYLDLIIIQHQKSLNVANGYELSLNDLQMNFNILFEDLRNVLELSANSFNPSTVTSVVGTVREILIKFVDPAISNANNAPAIIESDQFAYCWLNALGILSKMIEKLSDSFLQRCQSRFSGDEISVIQSGIQELNQHKIVIDRTINEMCKSIGSIFFGSPGMVQFMRDIIQLRDSNVLIEEADFYEKCTMMFNKIFGFYQENIEREVFHKLMMIIGQAVSSSLENKLKGKQLNDLGKSMWEDLGDLFDCPECFNGKTI